MLREPQVRVLGDRLVQRLRAIHERTPKAGQPFPVVPAGSGIESGFRQPTQ